jgi:GTP-binding protein
VIALFEMGSEFSRILDYSGGMKIEFITSAAKPADWPPGAVPEIALTGRSNAGKSTFINAFSGRSIAKVSQKPGKTQLLNFFSVGENYRIVDMPGYGYSRASGDIMAQWESLVEAYLANRPQLVGIILFSDVRRQLSSDEDQVLDFVAQYGRKAALVLTKCDQISRSEIGKKVEEAKRHRPGLPVFPVSERDRPSVKSVEDFVFKNWVKNL